MENTEPMKKDSIPRWINTILVTVLLGIMSVSIARTKELNDNTEVLQVEMAVLCVKFDNHIEYSVAGMETVSNNALLIQDIKGTYVTREEIHSMFAEMRQYIKDNK